MSLILSLTSRGHLARACLPLAVSSGGHLACPPGVSVVEGFDSHQPQFDPALIRQIMATHEFNPSFEADEHQTTVEVLKLRQQFAATKARTKVRARVSHQFLPVVFSLYTLKREL